MGSAEPGTVPVVRERFQALGARLRGELELTGAGGRSRRDRWQGASGEGETWTLDGEVFERAVIGVAALHGSLLPTAATERRLELAGSPYRALTLVAALHPRNPCVPAAHLHLRFLTTTGAEPVGWFAGGFELIPSVPFEEDARHWHRTARDALLPFGEELHPRFKEACDRATYLPHRGECLGVGGIAFEDLDDDVLDSVLDGDHDGGFDRSLSLAQAVGEAFIAGYAPILSRRREHPYGERERRFQLERRGRTVEYLLLRDRLTLSGLRSGGRADAALLALPPSAEWPDAGGPRPGSPEERLLREFLQPRDWLAEERLAGSMI